MRAKAIGVVTKRVQRLAYTERVFDGQPRIPTRRKEYGSPEQ